MPLPWNQFQAVVARSSQSVSPVSRLCSAAARRAYSVVVMAFLYVRSRSHHTPPPQLAVSQRPLT